MKSLVFVNIYCVCVCMVGGSEREEIINTKQKDIFTYSSSRGTKILNKHSDNSSVTVSVSSADTGIK